MDLIVKHKAIKLLGIKHRKSLGIKARQRVLKPWHQKHDP